MREGGYLDDEMRKAVLRERLKKQSNGEKQIVSKYRPKYPDSAEREYIRMLNDYMKLEKEILLKHIPELKQIINEGTVQYNIDSKKDNENDRKVARFESIDNTIARIKILFDVIRKEIDGAFGLYGLKKKLQHLASLNRKLTIREWKKAIAKTLGINILEDYYSGEFYQAITTDWISDNVDLIKTIPQNSLDKMKEIVYEGYMKGSSTTDIVKAIQRQYGVDKRRAKLIARDQTAKLNADITKHQQTDAGVNHYKWSGVRDQRERASHLRLEGHIFSWNNPPETDGGRRCHPGQDYQCRCCAIPVFDLDELDLPAE